MSKTGIVPHYSAGTGRVCYATREEHRLRAAIISELPKDTEIAEIEAGNAAAKLRDAKTGKLHTEAGFANALGWAAKAAGRVLIVYDWHTICNNPGSWRMVINMTPEIRNPPPYCHKCKKTLELAAQACDKCDSTSILKTSSLVVFVAPAWNFEHVNPLRGCIPIINFDPPNRDEVREILTSVHQLNGDADDCIAAVDGLGAEAIEQIAAESLVRSDFKYDPAMLRERKCDELRREGLEIWSPVTEMGGLSSLQEFLRDDGKKWLRDPQLSVRRFLNAGVFGMGKSFAARLYGHMIGAVVACCEIPKLKEGIVGASEGNLERVLSVVDAMARYSPVILVLDEIDTIAREGLDGGTSSGMFQMLLTWLQESSSLVTVWATLNRLDKLDPALMSRFQAQFFYDLGDEEERRAVAEIHYRKLGAADPSGAAEMTAKATEGFSSREIAEHICRSVCRMTDRKPTEKAIEKVVRSMTPASVVQAHDLKLMREAAQTLRRANNPIAEKAASRGGRRVAAANA